MKLYCLYANGTNGNLTTSLQPLSLFQAFIVYAVAYAALLSVAICPWKQRHAVTPLARAGAMVACCRLFDQHMFDILVRLSEMRV